MVRALAVLGLAAAVAMAAEEGFSPAEMAWFEEVEMLMSTAERDVFLSVPADERAAFMKQFWEARDPVPSTEVNELEVEHRRRVRHADEQLREGGARRGAKSERGWAYIVLGPPRTVLRFSGKRELFPVEVWQYEGRGRPGLPAQFYLTFFRPLGIGEYRLYNPAVDRPAALVAGGTNRSIDDAEAVSVLRGIDPELARSALAIDAGGPHDFDGGSVEQGVGPELARLRRITEREAPDEYARSWGSATTQVDAVLSYRPFDVAAEASRFRGPDGSTFVRYLLRIEAQDLVLEAAEGRFHLGLELYVVLLDAAGTELMDASGRTETSLSGAELERVRSTPLCVSGLVAGSAPARGLRFILRQPGRLTRAVGRAEVEIGGDAERDAAESCPWQMRLQTEPLEHPNHRRRRARQLEQAGDLEGAVRELRGSLDASPEMGPELAGLLLRLGRAREAAELLGPRAARWLATVGELEAGQLEELAAAASAHVLVQEYDRAAELYARAVEAQPRSIRLLNALAAIEQARGRLQRAAELYRRSLEVDPDQPRIRELLKRVEG